MLSFIATAAVFVGVCTAQVSLYIPGFDSQPVSADILGVDSQGQTTWALHQGQVTGTDSDFGFEGTLTLVEGPSSLSLTIAQPEATGAVVCALKDGVADCTAQIGGSTIVTSDLITPIEVQVGTTAAGVVVGGAASVTLTAGPGALPTLGTPGSGSVSNSKISTSKIVTSGTGTSPSSASQAPKPSTSSSASVTSVVTWAGAVIPLVLMSLTL